MRPVLIAFAAALTGALALTLLVRWVARRAGWVAKPRSDRWHKHPTALSGGVAIYGSFLLALCAYALFANGKMGRTPFDMTDEQTGSFPNDVAVVVLPEGESCIE
jgi:UDP-N-acetylmuramyl pentapeptide phosphotransferase/UDP-N-acetylglucosamine-1-phosphate transferase